MSDIEKTIGRRFIRFQSGLPAQEDVLDANDEQLPDFDRAAAERFFRVFGSYRHKLRAVLRDQMPEARQFIPEHLFTLQKVLICYCPDGVVIRYEPTSADKEELSMGITNNSLSDAVEAASEGWLRLHDPSKVDDRPPMMTFRMRRTSRVTGKTDEVLSVGLGITARIPTLEEARGLGRPSHVATSSSSLTIALHGVLGEDPRNAKTGFITQMPVRLPVGWNAIDVYAPFLPEQWEDNNTTNWAMSDIFGIVARRHIEESKWSRLDPDVSTRERLAAILEAGVQLFREPEQKLQTFLEANSFILCGSYTKVWRKMPFGKTVSDFVFRQGDGSYLLVEIERPDRHLLRGDGQQHNDLTHAINQITDWRRYIEDNLATVRSELGLAGITSSPNMLVVIGRSTELDNERRRKLQAIQDQMPKLRILTWDDLFLEAKSGLEAILGPLPPAESSVRTYFYPLAVGDDTSPK